jgi:hypothetical protein
MYQLVGGVATDEKPGVINLGYCPDDRTQTPGLLQYLANASDGAQYANAAATLSYTGLFGLANSEEDFEPGILLTSETTHVYLDNSPCLTERAKRALPQVISTQSYSVTLHNTIETVENDTSLTLVSTTSRSRRPDENYETFIADTLGISPQLHASLDLVLYDDGLTVLSDAETLSQQEFHEVVATARSIEPVVDEDVEKLLEEDAREVVRATGSDATVRALLQKFAEASAKLHLNEAVTDADVEDATALLTSVLVNESAHPPEPEPAPKSVETDVPAESIETTILDGDDAESSTEEESNVIDPETGEVRSSSAANERIMVAEEGSASPTPAAGEGVPDKLQSFFEGAEQADEQESSEHAEPDDAEVESNSPIIEAGPGGTTIDEGNEAKTSTEQSTDSTSSDIITDTGYGAVDLSGAAATTVENSITAGETESTNKTEIQRKEDDHVVVEMKKADKSGVSVSDVRRMADLVNDLGANYDGCKVPGEVVFEKAREEGLDKDDAAEALTRLTDSGEIIYYKRTGKFLSP